MKDYHQELRSMQVKYNSNVLEVEGLTNFHPEHIFECGQAFRWNWDGKGYVGVVADKVVRTIWDGATLYIENATLKDFDSFWYNYFDLQTNYGEIIDILSKDSVMKKAVKYGWGIRILNQDPWETLISFIISANNGIKRIKSIIERLSYRFGEKIIWQDHEYYMFPSIEALASATEENLRECGCGYRAPFIQKTVQLVQEGLINLNTLRHMDYLKAKEQLLKFPGVGPKVADCILLFSLGKSEAFPVDVWIERIVETLYYDEVKVFKDIRQFAADKFGPLAGYAQQYLFYYAREKKIGK